MASQTILIETIGLPVWAQYVLGVGAILTALAVIWKYVLHPTLRFYSTAEEMVPLLKEFAREFRDSPHAFAVLDEIVAQFRTDSGSSLRDAVDRLEKAAFDNRAAADVLKVGVETSRLLADQDRSNNRAANEALRQDLHRLVLLLDRLSVKVDSAGLVGLRIEDHAAGVAADLADAHKRADAIIGEPGAAADAAAQQTIKEKEKK